eukprot:1977355-Alexandrium_andersonii.AAC.1
MPGRADVRTSQGSQGVLFRGSKWFPLRLLKSSPVLPGGSQGLPTGCQEVARRLPGGCQEVAR